ncbi:MAG: hypothetical protein H6577_07570 [Lewinellaceae bacterium]|nr:hypothetical protein [Saprospiraceae bacterium]MCB9337971.1 hypothetical protein [Lewinellaceae bacterium]
MKKLVLILKDYPKLFVEKIEEDGKRLPFNSSNLNEDELISLLKDTESNFVITNNRGSIQFHWEAESRHWVLFHQYSNVNSEERVKEDDIESAIDYLLEALDKNKS